MSHGHTRIASKGKCIYCGDTTTPLTDEHIVPFALGGHHVIVDASCQKCAEITGRFEQDVARGMWGDARVAYAGPSRRKKLRPKDIVLTDPDDPRHRIKVPFSEYPAPIIFYTMATAGLLSGLACDTDTSAMWGFSAVSDHDKNVEFEKKFGMKLTAKFRNMPESFARMIAKIGYGQVLTALDLDDFNAICVPYILGQKKNLSYIVGSLMSSRPPDVSMGYVLRTFGCGDHDRLLLVAEVRLYANNQTPVYHVVVGDVVGAGQVDKVWQKLSAADAIEINSSMIPGYTALGENHWVPRVWPLPYWISRKPR